MNIIEKVIAIRDSLPQVSSNLIDFSLNPIPPFCGKKTICIYNRLLLNIL